MLGGVSSATFTSRPSFMGILGKIPSFLLHSHNLKVFCFLLDISLFLLSINLRAAMATTAPAPEDDTAPVCGCFEICFPRQEPAAEEPVTKDIDTADAADAADPAQDDATASSASEESNTAEEDPAKASEKSSKKTHRVRRWIASRSSEAKSITKRKKKSKSKESS